MSSGQTISLVPTHVPAVEGDALRAEPTIGKAADFLSINLTLQTDYYDGSVRASWNSLQILARDCHLTVFALGPRLHLSGGQRQVIAFLKGILRISCTFELLSALDALSFGAARNADVAHEAIRKFALAATPRWAAPKTSRLLLRSKARRD